MKKKRKIRSISHFMIPCNYYAMSVWQCSKPPIKSFNSTFAIGMIRIVTTILRRYQTNKRTNEDIILDHLRTSAVKHLHQVEPTFHAYRAYQTLQQKSSSFAQQKVDHRLFD